MRQAASWPAAPHDMAKMKADPELAAAGKKVLDAHKRIIAEMQKMVAQMEKQMKLRPSLAAIACPPSPRFAGRGIGQGTGLATDSTAESNRSVL